MKIIHAKTGRESSRSIREDADSNEVWIGQNKKYQRWIEKDVRNIYVRATRKFDS